MTLVFHVSHLHAPSMFHVYRSHGSVLPVWASWVVSPRVLYCIFSLYTGLQRDWSWLRHKARVIQISQTFWKRFRIHKRSQNSELLWNEIMLLFLWEHFQTAFQHFSLLSWLSGFSYSPSFSLSLVSSLHVINACSRAEEEWLMWLPPIFLFLPFLHQSAWIWPIRRLL